MPSVPADVIAKLRAADPVLGAILAAPGGTLRSANGASLVVLLPKSNRNAGLMGLLGDRKDALEQTLQQHGIRLLQVKFG